MTLDWFDVGMLLIGAAGLALLLLFFGTFVEYIGLFLFSVGVGYAVRRWMIR